MKTDALVPLNLPPYPFKISEQDGQLVMFDNIRKKTIIITPEEWVRQHFIQYLINHKQYPRSLIKLEGGHKLYGKSKRSDIVVYNPDGKKILLVECKAPIVTISQASFDQISRYNIIHQVEFLAVTNGLNHFYYQISSNLDDYRFIPELPGYEP